MSVNSATNSSDSSLHLFLDHCFQSRTTIFIFTATFLTSSILLLPLLSLVLYVVLHLWRKQRSSSTAAVMSHSDFFTYNVAALELIGLVGAGLYSFGGHSEGQGLQLLGNSIFSISSHGQTLLHLLTCVEHYLAVVCPIIYRGLKQAGGLRMRNIITGCVWLLCFGLVGVSKLLSSTLSSTTNLCILVFSILITSFCNVSVLRVLNHPGQVNGVRERVDQSKQRAFHTIMVILVAQLLRFVGLLVYSVMFSSERTYTRCVVGASAVWLTVPSSLVLPLLFLHKNLPGCSHSTDSA